MTGHGVDERQECRFMCDRRRRIRRGAHSNAIVPKGRQADVARADEIVRRACHEETPVCRQAEPIERQLVRTRVGFVEARILSRDDDIDRDADLSDRCGAESPRAIRHDGEKNWKSAQRAQHFADLRPRPQFPVARGELADERRGKADRGGCLRHKFFIRAIDARAVRDL